MSKKHQVITISPSGNLYGSENVLFDYLCTTELNHIVFVPKNSQFEKKLKSQKWNHRIKSFNPRRLEFLYTYLFIFLLFKKIKAVYLNEGGHINWIINLAKLLKKTNFVIHIRIIEDIPRIPNSLPSNIKIVTISKFMIDRFDKNLSPNLIYDSFNFGQPKKYFSLKKPITIGIIGRISINKGIQEIYQIICAIKNSNDSLKQEIRFVFFGSESSDNETQKLITNLKSFDTSFCHFAGFVDNSRIYEQIDIVLHLAKKEPLGRIFFEAMNYEIPLIGFKNGGIGELGKITNLEENLIDIDNLNWVDFAINIIQNQISHYDISINQIKKSKKDFAFLFDQNRYNSELNNAIQNN